MEPEQCTVSVIAQLMNLNNVVNPPFQSSPGPIRVLSDDYLQKTASIGLHRSLSSFQGSRRKKKQPLSSHNDCVASKRSLEEPKNAQNHLIVVNRAKSGIGLKKNQRQITSDFRFAKKKSPLCLVKTFANPNGVLPCADQETSPNGSNHLEEEENSRFLSSSCADYCSPSPISVLEPCLSDNSESIESTKSDVHGGIHGNLEFLISESEEMNSEVSGMMVSSDEDEENTEELIEEDQRQMMELFGVQGSRDFSYIVDALDEAGFYGNETLSFDRWYSEELPISPIIFEILEKKFGKQKTWERWERKLLFDRINVALRHILHHQPCRSNSRQLRRIFEFWQRREVVEDELWTFLINEEKVRVKETQMKVAEKVLSANEGVKWLDLHEEIDIFVAEIETSLFRELEEELVC
ncbi:uncharacterized protein LOC124930876 [Impatiens glandulifera]|uniref:uncharacterized protein LOC124930876 n=1 Tax=Impatiens glandulifera TaxID=253017 RepID=UPI001FB0E620|nr:uncharacterized protein LOC124930876 [Impatiens glandulifera]XP_047327201.1 uncharacterized protein LOC124930876 [Impatiens glandulifera]